MPGFPGRGEPGGCVGFCRYLRDAGGPFGSGGGGGKQSVRTIWGNQAGISGHGGGLRPNRTGTGVTNTGADPKVNRLAYLNPAAFSVQTVNTAGNASRNVALGPKAFQLNLSLVKRFAVTERTALDLRLEAFNAFNTVNFGNPAATFGSSSFGQITSAGDPRVVQVAIRYRF